MKLDRETELLAQDIYIRHVTNSNFQGDVMETAKLAIQQSLAFTQQWEVTQDAVQSATAKAVEQAKPMETEKPAKDLRRDSKPGKAPVKELRSKAKGQKH
jgi:hypothetical protein